MFWIGLPVELLSKELNHFGAIAGLFRQIVVLVKVIREKSRGEGSLIVQDTIENVSEPNCFFKLFKKKNIHFLVSFYAKNVFTV